MLERFNNLKKGGGKIALGDVMTQNQKDEFLSRNTAIDLNDVHIKSFKKCDIDMIEKYFNKLSRSTKINTLIMLNDISFMFEFDSEYYHITYDYDSLCMMINKGKNIDEDNATEIGLYELEKYF
jgi:hypothetical protein